MTKSISRTRLVALAASTIALTGCLTAWADDDTAQFATGGYSTGMRTEATKNRMHADGNGPISRAEWDAHQEMVFKHLDSHNRGKLNVDVVADRAAVRLGTDFATGGYSRGLTSQVFAHEIDVNGDGWISHEEWLTYQARNFNRVNETTAQKNSLREDAMFNYLHTAVNGH